jgi:hypothetical protein
VQIKVDEEIKNLKKVDDEEEYLIHSDYEGLLRKLEADIRNHIRVFNLHKSNRLNIN